MKRTWWLVGSIVIVSLWVLMACSGTDESVPGESIDNGGSVEPTDPTAPESSSGTDGSSSTGKDSSSEASTTLDASMGTDASSGGTAISTDANLKVAFIGDTSTGSDFKSVLALVKQEGASMVMIQGDLTYGFDSASSWFSAIDNAINKDWPGSSATVTIPYFVARGNHDSDWTALGKGLADRMTKWGVASENNDPTKQNYSVVYKGLKMVMAAPDETSPSRADYVKARLANDNHVWKVCSWHKNMRASNVGPKNDEMGWSIYENCRDKGAIVAQGHSHTYSRSKTLANDANQTVDSACSDPFALCVGAGKHFFFDSSLGGVDTRSLNSTVAAKPYWGSTYTGSYGALFIEFNVGGDPKKAQGYFKTIGNVVIDPPANSGKTKFTITAN